MHVQIQEVFDHLFGINNIYLELFLTRKSKLISDLLVLF